MYSIGDVVKVVSWEEMKGLAADVWNCGDYDEKITVCEFDYGVFDSNEGRDICGQIGVVVNILKVKGIVSYKIKFFSDELKSYDVYFFEEYLLKPYKLQCDIEIIFPKFKKGIIINELQMELIDYLLENNFINEKIAIKKDGKITEINN